jgi:hypothetical protein
VSLKTLGVGSTKIEAHLLIRQRRKRKTGQRYELRKRRSGARENKERGKRGERKSKIEAATRKREYAIESTSRYIKVKVEHYLLFMFSPLKISWVISEIKYICLHLLPVFYLIQPSSKQIICFDFRKQNSVLPKHSMCLGLHIKQHKK